MQNPSSCFKFLLSHFHPVRGRNKSRYGISVMILGCCSAIPFCWSFQAFHRQGGWWECPCHHNHICPDFGTGNHSVPPSPPQHPLSLGELSARDTGEQHFGLQISGFWACGYKLEARGGEIRRSRYLCFERPIVKHECFSDCTLHGTELCCQLQQSWWIELTFPLHVSALSTLFLCPQMNLLWNVLAGLL